jgi:hypothetical protein
MGLLTYEVALFSSQKSYAFHANGPIFVTAEHHKAQYFDASVIRAKPLGPYECPDLLF